MADINNTMEWASKLTATVGVQTSTVVCCSRGEKTEVFYSRVRCLWRYTGGGAYVGTVRREGGATNEKKSSLYWKPFLHQYQPIISSPAAVASFHWFRVSVVTHWDCTGDNRLRPLGTGNAGEKTFLLRYPEVDWKFGLQTGRCDGWWCHVLRRQWHRQNSRGAN